MAPKAAARQRVVVGVVGACLTLIAEAWGTGLRAPPKRGLGTSEQECSGIGARWRLELGLEMGSREVLAVEVEVVVKPHALLRLSSRPLRLRLL